MAAAAVVRQSPALRLAAMMGYLGAGCGQWGSTLQRRRRHDGGSPMEEEEEPLPAEWRRAAYPSLIKLASRLKNLDRVDSRVITIDDGMPVADAGVISQMQTFKSLASAFIWSAPSFSSSFSAAAFFSGGPEKKRGPMALTSLTGLCDFLSISAQQRKSIRLTISPQVTQHHIWRGAVEELLRNLGAESRAAALGRRRSPALRMAEQIAASCLRFLADAEQETTPLWMKLSPEKRKKEGDEREPLEMRQWGEVLEMFGHLSACLAEEEKLWAAAALGKVEAMKEGLYQIKDLLVEREIGYREARRQDSLVQKRLSKGLGHSSRCLFTLLVYYLYGAVSDLEVDLCGLFGDGAGRRRVSAGKVLTAGDERMVGSALKQLDRVLGVLKLVWETAGEKRAALDLRGHIWWVGAEPRSLMYRGNWFFIHDLKL
ncbi:unnamed protein product [Spirodela intermedia]|uniref:Uncharacterized protein n=1 Tax=Spirodela intermedia TaxID=51605 RepID=A0A7I8LJ81_SPIIN|nr:unnamed protein product [Spirodela intermedia]